MKQLIETLPKPEEMKNERYFQIRDCGKDGCGSFEIFCVEGETPEDAIYQISCDIQTARMEKKEKIYTPGFFFREPPKWRPTIKVIEYQRGIEPLAEPNKFGKTFTNLWKVKRGGLKFTIVNNWIRVKLTNGETKSGNGYIFGSTLKN